MTLISIYYKANLSDDEHKKLLAARLLDIQREGKVNLLTVAADGAETNNVKNQQQREFSKAVGPFVNKSAVVGLTKKMKVTLASIRMLTGREIMVFESEAEAMAWLREP